MPDNVNKKTIAVYPGTFDPITLGHLDIIKRTAKLTDELIIAVAKNEQKSPLFSTEERVRMVEIEVKEISDALGTPIKVMAFDNLLIDFAEQVNASMIIRGLRTVTDFDFEFQMVGMNSYLSKIETVFLMAKDKYQFISSRFVKEISTMGGDISSFVTKNIEKELKNK